MEDNQNTQSKIYAIPGAGFSYSQGWKIMKTNFLELLLIVVLQGLLAMPIGYYQRHLDSGSFDFISYLFSLAYLFLIYVPLNFGAAYAFLKAVRGEKVKATDLFKCFENFWNVVLGNLLMGAIVGFGIALLVIPGLFFLSKLIFTPYYLVDKKMEAIEAIKASWNNTTGFTSRIIGILLLAVPVFIVGGICLGVGVIVSIMLISTALAYFYNSVNEFQEFQNSETSGIKN